MPHDASMRSAPTSAVNEPLLGSTSTLNVRATKRLPADSGRRSSGMAPARTSSNALMPTCSGMKAEAKSRKRM